MKLTESDKEKIKQAWGDWEVVHSIYDGLLKERLRELDPEYVEDLDTATEDATFWYA